ncbi:hypothetical protein ACFL6Y_03495 [Elusimicrobiota bacterium]
MFVEIVKRYFISNGVYLLLLHLIACLLCWEYFPFGFFHDDSIYWVGAKSLSEGSYRLIASPEALPLANYPIGYPMVLSLLISVISSNPFAAQVLSLLLSLLAVILVFRLSGLMLPNPANHALAAWLAIHPISTRYSSTVLSEPLYLVVSLIILLFYISPVLQEKLLFLGKKRAIFAADIAIGLLCGYLMLIRTVGIALPTALLIDLALNKKWERICRIAGTVSVIFIPWLLWTFGQTSTANTQLSQLGTAIGWSPVNLVKQVVRQTLFYAQQFSLNCIFPVAPIRATIFNFLFWGIISTAITWTAFATALKTLFSGAYRVIAFYFMLYLAILLIWSHEDVRYLYPVLFIAGLLFLCAINRFLDQQPRCASGTAGFKPLFRQALMFITAFLALQSTIHQAAEIRTSRNPGLPLRSFLWIKHNIPKNTAIASASLATVYNYSGIKGREFPRIKGSENILQAMNEQNIDFVLIEGSLAGPHKPSLDITNWTPHVAQALADCRNLPEIQCKLIYSNKEEDTWIFHLKR